MFRSPSGFRYSIRHRSVANRLGLAALLLFSAFLLVRGGGHRPGDPEPVLSPPADPPREGRSGPEVERAFFSKWHEPYDAALPREVVDALWSEVSAVPSEESMRRSVSPWQLRGPYSMINNIGDAQFTGRVLDIEVENGAGLRVAAASGGLWGWFFIVPYPMSDRITSQAIGSFATDPTDPDRILVGTGEPEIRTGTGMWETTDGGAHWNPVNMPPVPGAFYRVRFDPDEPTRVHAVSTAGYYRSTDRGATWSRRLAGFATDLAFDPVSSDTIYTRVSTTSLHRSTDNGVTWAPFTGTGLPTANFGRTALAVAPTDRNRIYASIAHLSSQDMLGVYRSTDRGATWTAVNPPEFMRGQGYYDNVLSVCPTNRDLVLVGGVHFYRSTNGGTNWDRILVNPMHDDHHAMTWESDGVTVWCGNDGGITRSTDGGATWSTALNSIPITQYYHIAAGVSDPVVLISGAQDNGISVSTDTGIQWKARFGQDGGGVAVDPADATRLWMIQGPNPGSVVFPRWRSTNSGLDWSYINTGILPSTQWFTQIRHDHVPPVYLYTYASNHVYRSTDGGDVWTDLFAGGFQANVGDLSVSRWGASNDFAVYACFETSVDFQRLFALDLGIWFIRDIGLPSGVPVRHVSPHPLDNHVAYALMDGLSSPGEKVFKTTNRGIDWMNVTGDLPNLPLADLVAHPTDDSKLYVGSEMGCFRTSTGGETWERWNYGLPEAPIVTEFVTVDSLNTNGRFYVVAGTYGRGVWTREIIADDPLDLSGARERERGRLELSTSGPNPFRDRTAFTFHLPSAGPVRLTVHDVAGRRVALLHDGTLPAGTHRRELDGRGLAAGVYFARLTAGGETVSTKLLSLR